MKFCYYTFPMNWNLDITVRFLAVNIENVKNIKKGKIHVKGYSESEGVKNYNQNEADIIGLYGQNGSGKTSVIDTLSVFKKIVTTEPFYNKNYGKNELGTFISIDADKTEVTSIFLVTDGTEKHLIKYSFIITVDKNRNRIIISNESFEVLEKNKKFIKYDFYSEKNSFTSSERVMDSLEKESLITEICKSHAFEDCTSFIFQDDFLKVTDENSDLIKYLKLFKNYIRNRFLIIHKDYTDQPSQGFLPFYIRNDSIDDIHKKIIGIKIDRPTCKPLKVIPLLEKLIDIFSHVMSSIIPDMKIKLERLGEAVDENGEKGVWIEVMSVRGGKTIPLRYESIGIKKILSVVHYLILMYNSPGVFVAIDEVDASVFEYLLGDLLGTLKLSAAGQLLFTSHDLHPLEFLDRKSIYFTTTNPEKRFIKFTYLKPNHNLRDQYFRAIKLGGQQEEVYQESFPGDIGNALYAAGEDFFNLLDENIGV